MNFTLIAAISLIIFAELICRYGIGLGDPPLYAADNTLEYRLLPSHSYYRFHHLIHINQWSMRADDFPARKVSANELRILLLGDSILYGGVRVDQSETTAGQLQHSLDVLLHRPVIVGNACAKSWGPPNELAYLNRYGFFDSDVLVLVLNSGDYVDVPTFEPVVGVLPDYPSRRPYSALLDLIQTYAPRLRRTFHDEPQPAVSDRNATEALAAERHIFELAKAKHVRVMLVLWPDRNETRENQHTAGSLRLARVAEESDVRTIDMLPVISGLMRKHDDIYVDQMHPGSAGQKVLARNIESAIVSLLHS